MKQINDENKYLNALVKYQVYQNDKHQYLELLNNQEMVDVSIQSESTYLPSQKQELIRSAAAQATNLNITQHSQFQIYKDIVLVFDQFLLSFNIFLDLYFIMILDLYLNETHLIQPVQSNLKQCFLLSIKTVLLSLVVKLVIIILSRFSIYRQKYKDEVKRSRFYQQIWICLDQQIMAKMQFKSSQIEILQLLLFRIKNDQLIIYDDQIQFQNNSQLIQAVLNLLRNLPIAYFVIQLLISLNDTNDPIQCSSLNKEVQTILVINVICIFRNINVIINYLLKHVNHKDYVQHIRSNIFKQFLQYQNTLDTKLNIKGSQVNKLNLNIDMLSSLISFTSENMHITTVNLENVKLTGQFGRLNHQFGINSCDRLSGINIKQIQIKYLVQNQKYVVSFGSVLDYQYFRVIYDVLYNFRKQVLFSIKFKSNVLLRGDGQCFQNLFRSDKLIKFGSLKKLKIDKNTFDNDYEETLRIFENIEELVILNAIDSYFFKRLCLINKLRNFKIYLGKYDLCIQSYQNRSQVDWLKTKLQFKNMQYLSNMISDLILYYYKENKELCQMFSENFNLAFQNQYIIIDITNFDFNEDDKEAFIALYNKFSSVQVIEYLLDLGINEHIELMIDCVNRMLKSSQSNQITLVFKQIAINQHCDFDYSYYCKQNRNNVQLQKVKKVVLKQMNSYLQKNQLIQILKIFPQIQELVIKQKHINNQMNIDKLTHFAQMNRIEISILKT